MAAALAAFVVAVDVAACGTTSKSQSGAGGAPARPAQISAALHAREEALHRQVLEALHAPAPAHTQPGIPAYLRRATTRVNRVVVASARHPQLAIEGDSVWLQVAHGRSLATTYGPFIPYKVQGTAVAQTIATFYFKLIHTRGSLPLAARDFTIMDELGDTIVPRIEVVGGGALPARLTAGRSLSLRMIAELPVGNGQLRYSPTGIHGATVRPLAGWDFSIETT